MWDESGRDMWGFVVCGDGDIVNWGYVDSGIWWICVYD